MAIDTLSSAILVATATEISLIDWAAAQMGDTANVEAFAAWLADDTCMCWLPGMGR